MPLHPEVVVVQLTAPVPHRRIAAVRLRETGHPEAARLVLEGPAGRHRRDLTPRPWYLSLTAEELRPSDGPDGEALRSGRAMLAALIREGRPATSLVDHIVEDVAMQIILGRLAPGADVNSVELARRYGSSRTPVREALLTLHREGLVEIPARRRPRVALVTLDQVREIYQVRANLHGLVSELVVRNAGDAELAVLDEWQARLREDARRGAVDAYFWHNVGFRQAEAEIAGNRQLARLLGSLGLRTLQLRHVSLSLPGRVDRSLDDHDRMLRAYADRDAQLAVAITRSIIMAGYRAIEASGWPVLDTGRDRGTNGDRGLDASGTLDGPQSPQDQ